MPSPTQPRNVSLRDFTARPIGKRSVGELPPRPRQLIELMVWEGLTFADAAARMGLKLKTARKYQHHPRARAYYLSLLDQVRENELAQNLHTAVSIRNRSSGEPTAAMRRVALEAIKTIEQRDGGIDVNVSVGVGVNIQPGYQVSIPAEHVAGAERLLVEARSTRSVLNPPVDAEVVPEDHSGDGLQTGREPRPVAFGQPPAQIYPPRDSRLRRLPVDE